MDGVQGKGRYIKDNNITSVFVQVLMRWDLLI